MCFLPGSVPLKQANSGAHLPKRAQAMLIATRLDMARRLGGILAAADAGRLALAAAGTGPGAADALVALTCDTFASRLAAHAANRSLSQRDAA